MSGDFKADREFGQMMFGRALALITRNALGASVRADPDIHEISVIRPDHRTRFLVRSERSMKWGNLFLETWSNVEEGNPGWFVTSTADELLYGFSLDEGGHKWFRVSFSVLRALDLEKFKRKRTHTNIGTGGYHTEGVVVPITAHDHILHEYLDP